MRPVGRSTRRTVGGGDRPDDKNDRTARLFVLPSFPPPSPWENAPAGGRREKIFGARDDQLARSRTGRTGLGERSKGDQLATGRAVKMGGGRTSWSGTVEDRQPVGRVMRAPVGGGGRPDQFWNQLVGGRRARRTDGPVSRPVGRASMDVWGGRPAGRCDRLHNQLVNGRWTADGRPRTVTTTSWSGTVGDRTGPGWEATSWLGRYRRDGRSRTVTTTSWSPVAGRWTWCSANLTTGRGGKRATSWSPVSGRRSGDASHDQLVRGRGRPDGRPAGRSQEGSNQLVTGPGRTAVW